MKRQLIGLGAALLTGVVALATQSAAAKVEKLEILDVQSPAFGGRVFGAVGTYDKILARVTIAVDPADPHNSGIVDLALAPRNAQGQVEAVSEVEILRPTRAMPPRPIGASSMKC